MGIEWEVEKPGKWVAVQEGFRLVVAGPFSGGLYRFQVVSPDGEVRGGEGQGVVGAQKSAEHVARTLQPITG